MAFFNAPDGKRYVSRKAYSAHLRREQRRDEKRRFAPATASMPQSELAPKAPGGTICRTTVKRTGKGFKLSGAKPERRPDMMAVTEAAVTDWQKGIYSKPQGKGLGKA